MGYRNADGSFSDPCLRKIEPGEPYFILRGQDRLAPTMVRQWAQLAEHHGCPAEKVKEALEIADAMERWPNTKYPD